MNSSDSQSPKRSGSSGSSSSTTTATFSSAAASWGGSESSARCTCSSNGHSASRSRSLREPGEHPALDRAERDAEPLGELRLGQAAVVGELERLPLVGRQLREGGLDAAAFLAHGGLLVGRLRRGDRRVVERRPSRRRSSRRTRSTARRWTSVISQVETVPRAGSKAAAVRQAPRNASCTASSRERLDRAGRARRARRRCGRSGRRARREPARRRAPSAPGAPRRRVVRTGTSSAARQAYDLGGGKRIRTRRCPDQPSSPSRMRSPTDAISSFAPVTSFSSSSAVGPCPSDQSSRSRSPASRLANQSFPSSLRRNSRSCASNAHERR